MKVKILFIDDRQEIFNQMCKDIPVIWKNIEEEYEENGDSISLFFGQDEFILMQKQILLKSDIADEKEIQKAVKRSTDNLLESKAGVVDCKKAVLIVDMCLGNDNAPSPIAYFEGIKASDGVAKVMVTSTWITVAEEIEKRGNRDFCDFFYRRATDPISGQFLWEVSDHGGYIYQERVDEIKNKKLKNVLDNFIESDCVDLKYLATILLAAGLAAEEE